MLFYFYAKYNYLPFFFLHFSLIHLFNYSVDIDAGGGSGDYDNDDKGGRRR